MTPETSPMTAIIALNPQQMADAQSKTRTWVDRKLAAAEHDLAEANTVLQLLDGRGLSATSARALVDRAALRVRFYEKVKRALALGYYIIPPFDVQLFAIRTNHLPSGARSDRSWGADQKPAQLAIGAGEYVNPQTVRVPDGKRKTGSVKQDGSAVEVSLYRTMRLTDDIGLPVRAMKPTLIEAVGRALEEKVFDALGMAPAFRAADPIIAGQIRRPDGGVLTFLVAWWLDEGDL